MNLIEKTAHLPETINIDLDSVTGRNFGSFFPWVFGDYKARLAKNAGVHQH